ncbi:MAG: hypothetical protein EP333_06330 [Bacteroidetes bacterium]|nr:MAG: hypothetical protein EP333_06330 [Bacteroidota bacterium]
MRIIFLIVCLHTITQAQPLYTRTNSDVPIKKMIQGEWELHDTEVTSGFDYYTDSSRVKLDKQIQKIVFTKDSLIILPEQNLRYYSRYERKYLYDITYDTLLTRYSIDVFYQSKKRRQEIDSYEIALCSTDQLVILSHQHISTGLDDGWITIAYTYYRKNALQFITKLVGEWHLNNESPTDLLGDTDTNSYTFYRVKDSLKIDESSKYITLNFDVHKNQKTSVYAEGDKYFSSAVVMPFMTDPERNLIFLGNKAPIVFRVIFVSDEKLILMRNQDILPK